VASANAFDTDRVYFIRLTSVGVAKNAELAFRAVFYRH
jgi:hypothetical protein